MIESYYTTATLASSATAPPLPRPAGPNPAGPRPAGRNPAGRNPAPRRGAPEPGALRLGGGWFRVRGFETRRPGEPATAAPRTVGHVCLALGGEPAAGPAEAAAVCLRGPEPASKESAHGKVVFGAPAGETFVYQADRARRTAALCACGNASGASSALLAQSLGVRQVRQTLVLPDGRVGLEARVTPTPPGWVVEQSWVGVRFEAFLTRLLGREVAVCTGTLNDYLLVVLPGAASLESFGLDDAVAFWDQGRRRFGFDDPLRARLAAVSGGPAPRVRFFTCGRAHPGAPLTGLATLALAAGRLGHAPAFAALAAAGRVGHPRGADPLPAVRAGGGGTRIDLPAVHVALGPA